MENNADGKASIRFPDYIFTKIDSEDEDTSDKNYNETNVVTSRKFEHVRKWMIANMLLLVTVSGVLFGLFLGEFAPCVFSHDLLSGKITDQQNEYNYITATRL
jgi:hypothetical protein